MIEFLKHFFGVCGEPHLNIWTLLIATPFVHHIYYYFRKKKGGKQAPHKSQNKI